MFSSGSYMKTKVSITWVARSDCRMQWGCHGSSVCVCVSVCKQGRVVCKIPQLFGHTLVSRHCASLTWVDAEQAIDRNELSSLSHTYWESLLHFPFFPFSFSFFLFNKSWYSTDFLMYSLDTILCCMWGHWGGGGGLLWVGLNRCRVRLLLMNVILMKQCLTLFILQFSFFCIHFGFVLSFAHLIDAVQWLINKRLSLGVC